jgi:hypothetical protein
MAAAVNSTPEKDTYASRYSTWKKWMARSSGWGSFVANARRRAAKLSPRTQG